MKRNKGVGGEKETQSIWNKFKTNTKIVNLNLYIPVKTLYVSEYKNSH